MAVSFSSDVQPFWDVRKRGGSRARCWSNIRRVGWLCGCGARLAVCGAPRRWSARRGDSAGGVEAASPCGMRRRSRRRVSQQTAPGAGTTRRGAGWHRRAGRDLPARCDRRRRRYRHGTGPLRRQALLRSVDRRPSRRRPGRASAAGASDGAPGGQQSLPSGGSSRGPRVRRGLTLQLAAARSPGSGRRGRCHELVGNGPRPARVVPGDGVRHELPPWLMTPTEV